MKGLAEKAISQVNDNNKKQELNDKLTAILGTQSISKDSKDRVRKYEDLIRGGAFNLTIAMRIERTNYINSTFSKIGDLTLETINKLIKEGKCDAWFSIIQKDIADMKIDDVGTKYTLIEKLNDAMQNLKKNDYEDDDSQTYHMLTEFIKETENIDKSKIYRSAKLVKSAEALMTLLD